MDWDTLFRLKNDRILLTTEDFGRIESQIAENEKRKSVMNVEDPKLPKDYKLYIGLQIPKESIIGSIIQWKTNSVYSHAGISSSNRFEPFHDMIVNFRTSYDRLDFLFTGTTSAAAMDIYSIPITLYQLERFDTIIKYFQEKNSRGKMGYDFLSLIAALFRGKKAGMGVDDHKEVLSAQNLKDKNRFICSAFVASILSMVSPKIKWFIIKNDFHIKTFNPGQLLTIPGIQPEFRIEAGNGRMRRIPKEFYENLGNADKIKTALEEKNELG